MRKAVPAAWNINSLEFLGKNGKLTGVKVQPIDWKPNPEGGRPLMVEAGEQEIIKAEAVFLAMGFLKGAAVWYIYIYSIVVVYSIPLPWLPGAGGAWLPALLAAVKSGLHVAVLCGFVTV